MFRFLSRVFLFLMLSASSGRLVIGQIPGLVSPAPANTTSPSQSTGDQLGRETPRGAVMGFIQAAQDENLPVATRYFQPITGKHRPTTEEDQDLATQLLEVLNQKVPASSLDTLSRDPQGQLEDGLPPNEEKLNGVRASTGEPFSISLIRQADDQGKQLWYISRKSLQDIPEIYDTLHFSESVKKLPDFLVKNRFLAMPLWQWIAIVLLLPVALFIGWLIALLVRLAIRFVAKVRKVKSLPPFVIWKLGPGAVLLGAIIHYIFVFMIGASILYRQYYRRVIWILLCVAFYWMVVRMTRAIFGGINDRLARSGHMAERSLVSLGRRVLEAMIFIFLGLLVLSTFGVNVTAALAGLGIGGLAIGLGAQKTFENLLGGISILSDKAIQVGDVCKIGDQSGVVDDIGLRSTKIRTEFRTLLTIPNGTVATAVLENLSKRDKILSKQLIRLRYDLSSEHIRYSLDQVRQVIAGTAEIEAGSSRVRPVRFGEYAIEVEIYVYFQTRDYGEFLALQEEFMLKVKDALDRAGASIALPSQTTIVSNDAWVEAESSKVSSPSAEKGRGSGTTRPDSSKD